jgi:hypothetical protein
MLSLLAKNRQLLRVPFIPIKRSAFTTSDPPENKENENKVRVVVPTSSSEMVIGEGKEELTYSQEYYILNREEIL